MWCMSMAMVMTELGLAIGFLVIALSAVALMYSLSKLDKSVKRKREAESKDPSVVYL
jgi:uncharacterized membrane protein YciS (DUF1049 family)